MQRHYAPDAGSFCSSGKIFGVCKFILPIGFGVECRRSFIALIGLAMEFEGAGSFGGSGQV